MTLLVVSIGTPKVEPDLLKQELLSAHGDLLTFFVSVAVLAFYWLSNHHFVSHLRAVDSVYSGLNIIYLALIAFLPLPTALLDRYSALVVMLPVIVFMLAIPVGLLSSPTYALAIWILLNFPLRILVERRLGPTAQAPTSELTARGSRLDGRPAAGRQRC